MTKDDTDSYVHLNSKYSSNPLVTLFMLLYNIKDNTSVECDYGNITRSGDSFNIELKSSEEVILKDKDDLRKPSNYPEGFESLFK